LGVRAGGSRARRAAVACAICASLLGALASPAGADTSARGPAIGGVALHPWRLGPDATLPFWPFRDPTERERVFSAIQAMGIKQARVDLRWYQVEPWIKGVRDWSEFDAIHKSAQAHGVSLLPMVAMPPAWANGGGSAWKYPRNPKDFEDFLTAAMERYPDIPAWEIWNEPNLVVFSQPTVDPGKFVELLAAAHRAKERAGSHAAIVSGGLLSSLVDTGGFFEDMIKLHAFDYVDGFGIHPYSTQAPDKPGSSFLKLPYFRDRLVQIGKPNVGIWVTEYGASTSAVSTEYGPPMGGPQQADRLESAFAIATRWPWVQNLTWYEFEDLCDNPFDVMCNFGVVRSDLSPKPSSAALQDIVHGEVPKLSSSMTLSRAKIAGTRVSRSGRRAVTFTGRLSIVSVDRPSGPVTLTLSGPHRKTRQSATATGGRFTTRFARVGPGRWRAVAQYAGTSDYVGSTSDPVAFVIKRPRR